jgi:transcriptional regulator with XRE-family HTH domain
VTYLRTALTYDNHGRGLAVNRNQFRAALKELGLSQLKAGRLLGSSGRSARRWAGGHAAVPESAAMLLRLLMDRTITIADLERVKTAKRKRK